jgi:phosphoglycolate phosphatase-like HAD superfamily hydrolase
MNERIGDLPKSPPELSKEEQEKYDIAFNDGYEESKAETLERIKKLLNHLHSDQYPNFFVSNSFHDAFPELPRSSEVKVKKV